MDYSPGAIMEGWAGMTEKRGLRIQTLLQQGYPEVRYGDAMLALRAYHPRTQRSLLRAFFSDFPNGGAIAGKIYRVINVPWYSAESVANEERFVRIYFADHLERLRPFYEVDEKGDVTQNWEEARSAARVALWHTSWQLEDQDESYHEIGRAVVAVGEAVRPFVRSVLEEGGLEMERDRNVMLRAMDDASLAAEYEVISDLVGEENPWEPLLGIYEMGTLIDGFDGTLRLRTRRGTEEVGI